MAMTAHGSVCSAAKLRTLELQNKRCVIAEFSHTGHRVVLYMRLNLEAATSQGYEVKIYTTAEVANSQQFSEIRNEYPSLEVKIASNKLPNNTPTRNPIALLARQVNRVINLKQNITLQDCDLLVLNTFDDFSFAFWLWPAAKKPKVKGIWIAPKLRQTAASFKDRLRRGLGLVPVRLAATRLADFGLLTIDEETALYLWACRHRELFQSKLVLVNDVGEVPKPTVKPSRTYYQPGFRILVYGSLTMRKGVRELFGALEFLQRSSISVTLAGNPDSAVRNFVSELECPEHVSITTFFQHITAEDEKNLFHECDIVWLGYAKTFISSSGVLYQAWSAAKPVIAADHGLIGQRVTRYAAGITVDVSSPRFISDAISEICTTPSRYRELSENASRAAPHFTKANFVKSLKKILYD